MPADQRFQSFSDGASGVFQAFFQRVNTGLLYRSELDILQLAGLFILFAKNSKHEIGINPWR
jgi:hypothetical protein